MRGQGPHLGTVARLSQSPNSHSAICVSGALGDGSSAETRPVRLRNSISRLLWNRPTPGCHSGVTAMSEKQTITYPLLRSVLVDKKLSIDVSRLHKLSLVRKLFFFLTNLVYLGKKHRFIVEHLKNTENHKEEHRNLPRSY